MNGIHCTLMFENQKEETACLHVLGLLDPSQSRVFEAELAVDPDLARAVADFNETLTNLSSSTTRIELPPIDLKSRILDLVNLVGPRVWTDTSGHVIGINSAFTGLCGYSFREIAGRKPGHFLQGEATDQASIAALRTAINEGREHRTEMLNYHRDGTPYWVKIHVTPVHDELGNLTGFEAEEEKTDFPPALAAAPG
jgi:PAS domain S-box-containing protein